MRPEVNSIRFENSIWLLGNFTAANREILNRFQNLFRLDGDFTAASI